MRKTVSFILTSVFLLCLSCNSNVLNDEGDKILYPLEGTQWKFVGIIDSQTGDINTLEPKKWDDSYMFTFITDTVAKTLLDEYGGYRAKARINLNWIGRTFIETISRGPHNDTFRYALYSQNTKSYTVLEDELKFINDKDNFYILYKRIEP